MESLPFISDRLKDWIYGLPDLPPRVRTKPLQVICAGPSRSATESLAIALRKLGIETYHGWNFYTDNPVRCYELAKVMRKKWRGPPDGESHLTAADFDALFGHAEAVVDVPATFAFPELFTAFPDTKVILNTRRDLNAWHRSVVNNFVPLQQSWFLFVVAHFQKEMFWMRDLTHNYFIPGLLRSLWPSSTTSSILYCGKWAYRDHCNMVRGMVPKEQLLEWSVEDGWEPICKFLDKKVPDEPFPRANAGGDEFDKNINAIIEAKAKIALQRIALLVTFNVAAISYFIMLRRGRVGPPRFDQLRGLVGNVLSRIRGQ